jgi:hypothetical protein
MSDSNDTAPGVPGPRTANPSPAAWTRPSRQAHDGAYGRLLRNPGITWRLLRAFVPAEQLRGIRPEDLSLADSRHFLPGFRRRENDVLWLARPQGPGGHGESGPADQASPPGLPDQADQADQADPGDSSEQAHCYILIENQSTPDWRVLVRGNLYRAMIWDQIARSGPAVPGEDQPVGQDAPVDSPVHRLPKILTIILYNGRPRWHLPPDCFLLADSAHHRGGPDRTLFTILMNEIPESELDRIGGIVAAVILLERQSDEAGLARAMPKVYTYLESEDEQAVHDFLDWIGKFFQGVVEPEEIRRLRRRWEDRTMLAELIDDLSEKYWKEGQKKGWDDGQKKGWDEGHQDGIRKAKLEAARAMLEGGLSLEQALRFTGLTREQLLEQPEGQGG